MPKKFSPGLCRGTMHRAPKMLKRKTKKGTIYCAPTPEPYFFI